MSRYFVAPIFARATRGRPSISRNSHAMRESTFYGGLDKMACYLRGRRPPAIDPRRSVGYRVDVD